MKIAVTSTGPGLDAEVDPRFGRCSFFTLVDPATGAEEAFPNPFLDAAGGAGTQAAQWILEHEVEALLTGHCGPKAMEVLEGSGVRVMEDTTGTVREALERFRRQADDPSQLPADRRSPGGGRGPGGGMGRGSGRGAGGGRGLGRGYRHGRG